MFRRSLNNTSNSTAKKKREYKINLFNETSGAKWQRREAQYYGVGISISNSTSPQHDAA